MRVPLALVVGTIAFVAITVFEQLPVLGWLGGALSIAAWIWLARLLFFAQERSRIGTGIGAAWAAIVGAVTGFVGALTSWLAQTGNLFGFTTPPGDRFGAAFGFVGASLGILYWPLVGALVCVGAAFVATRRSRS